MRRRRQRLGGRHELEPYGSDGSRTHNSDSQCGDSPNGDGSDHDRAHAERPDSDGDADDNGEPRGSRKRDHDDYRGEPGCGGRGCGCCATGGIYPVGLDRLRDSRGGRHRRRDHLVVAA